MSGGDEIVWSGWLQKKGGDSTGIVKGLGFMGITGNKERFFVLKRRGLTYYAPPPQITRGSIFIESPTPKALTDLGFVKKGSVEIDEILHMKKSEIDQSLQLVTTSGRVYEVSGFDDSSSSLELTSFEGCLHNLGIKLEVELSSIYGGQENFEGGSGLRAADLAAAQSKATGKAAVAAASAKATAAATAAAGVPLPTAAGAAAAVAAAAAAAAAGTTATPAPATPAGPLTGKDLLKRPANFQSNEDHMSDLVTNRERTIDEMKIQTMYKMVEDVEITVNGRNLEKKVLYLTNKQCNMFDDVGILRCLQALDLGKPKCVIRLLSAEKGMAQYAVHTNTRGYVLAAQQYASELGPHDAARTQTQLDLFMKTCILPLAMETHALIICSGCNDDALAASLERVVVPEQVRLGRSCPFKVLTFVWAFEVHFKAYSGDGIAGKVAAESPSWGIRLDAISQFMADYTDKNLQRCDLIQSASHVVVFETFEDGKALMGPSKTFQAKLMDAMSDQLPSIAIQTFACNYDQIADLSRRGIPILFLDQRERAITMRALPNSAARTLTTHLAKATDAFPTILAEHLSSFPKNPDGTITFQAKRSLLHLAFRMIESQINALADQCIVDYDNSSSVALIHAALLFGIDGSETDGAQVPLYARIQELKRAEMEARTNTGKALIPAELVREAARFLNTRLRTPVTRGKLAQVRKWLKENPAGSKFDHPKGLGNRWEDYLQKNLTVAESNGGEYVLETDAASFLNILDILSAQLTFSGSIFDLEQVNRTISSVVRIDRLPKSNSMEALLSLQDAWDHVDAYHKHADFYKILTKLSYALLLLAGIATSIIAISREKVDGEDSSDSGGNTESQYAILAISLLVTTVVGYVNFMNPAQRWQQLRGAAMNMEAEIWMFRTRAGDYRAGLIDGADTGYADELLQQRIQEIKDAVLEGADIKTSSFFGMFASPNLHSQHSPNYRPSKSARIASGCLAACCGPCCCMITSAASADDIESAQSPSSPSKPRGQAPPTPIDRTGEDSPGAGAGSGYAVAGEDGAEEQVAPPVLLSSAAGTSIDELLTWLGTRFVTSTGEAVKPRDNHYQPVLPNNYVTFRIERALKFYKKRIPRCNTTRHLGQLLSTIGSLAGVVLSFLGKVEWTVITAIGVTGVMAWLEFQGTNNKIERYSSVVDALQKHIVWWKTRPPIEKSATENIDRLVLACEAILRDEMNAWRSSSAQQSKMLADSAEGGGKSKEA